MARIRSIHPGFFNDEDLVAVSMAARLLVLGLGIESDDKGIFEWKPLTIKMKVFPADNVDIPALLAELEGANAILQYEVDGRKYGAIRNFRKHQRPKTPNDIFPADDNIRTYVFLSPPISETLPQSGGNASEIRPQMEDGGDKMEEEEKSAGEQKSYAFEGKVVRLLQRDYDQWRKVYSAIPDLTAELTALDVWAANQSAEKQKGWFQSVSGSLNRKHQELLARKADNPGRLSFEEESRQALYKMADGYRSAAK